MVRDQPCHMAIAPDGSRFWLPGCMGGAVAGRSGCTCRKVHRARENPDFPLHERLDKLERRIASLEVRLRKRGLA